MHLAPDEYAGFTMTLLRMLAFSPAPIGDPRPATPRAAPLTAQPVLRTTAPRGARRCGAARRRQAAPAVVQPCAAPAVFDGDWPALVVALKVAGLVKELAQPQRARVDEGDVIKLARAR